MPYNISEQRRGSLQRQIIVWVSAVLVALTICSLVYDYYAQKKILMNNFHASMLQAANHISLALKDSPDMYSATNTLNEYCKVMSKHNDPYHEITLIDNSGKVIASSKRNSSGKSLKKQTKFDGKESWDTITRNMNSYTVLTFPFKHNWTNRNFEGVIQYIENNNMVNQLLNHLFWNRAILQIAIIIIISALLYIILKIKVLSPLDHIFLQSYAVSTGDYDIWHVPDPGNEIGDIQSMLNFMIEKVRSHEESSINEMRESTKAEFLSQVYNSMVTSSSRINASCDNILNNHKSQRDEQLNVQIIKNECQIILDDLSKLIELKELNAQSTLKRGAKSLEKLS